MTPEAFCYWLAEMKRWGLADTDKEAGKLLGVSANSIVLMKRRGADMRTALACAALARGLGPYTKTK